MVEIDEFGRIDPPGVNGPVETVASFHRFLRSTLLWKADGLTDDQVRWSPVESGTSLLALIKHSINVERYWISDYIAGLPVSYDWSEDAPNAEWLVAPNETYDSLKAAWLEEAARTEEIIGGLSDSDWMAIPGTATAAERGRCIGWVLTHMVEEVGRHCGHADLIREMIDGSVGE